MSDGRDTIYEAFLGRQLEEALALAAESDLLDVQPLPGSLPQRLIAEYRCKGLVRTAAGSVLEADHFAVGFFFPSTYLRYVHPAEVITFLGPLEIYLPNVLPPMICVGSILPGTPIVDLLYRTFAVIAGQRVTMHEQDALNFDACRWARGNQHRFPVDRRPLKWRKPSTRIAATAKGVER